MKKTEVSKNSSFLTGKNKFLKSCENKCLRIRILQGFSEAIKTKFFVEILSLISFRSCSIGINEFKSVKPFVVPTVIDFIGL